MVGAVHHIPVSAPDMAPQMAMPMFIWLTHPQSNRPQRSTSSVSRQNQALSTLAFQWHSPT
jgi:hypothetical protein